MTNFIDDISSVTGADLGEIDQPDASEPYDDVKAGGKSTPPAGRYNLQLPEQISVGAWPAKDGRPASLELNLDPLVVVNPGDVGDGLKMRFVSVSTRRIGDANASTATDLLQRMGYSPMPRTPEEWQDAARAISGGLVEGVYCDWECRAPKGKDPDEIREFLRKQKFTVTDKRARKVLIRGMKHFPQTADGKRKLSKIVFENGPGGETLTLYANLVPTLRGFGLTEEERAAREG